MTSGNSGPEPWAELADLRVRLAEAEETLRAIRDGEVDALVIAGNRGEQVHLLGEGDRIYRQFIEAVSEGTATLSASGDILSCNDCLAKTLRRPLDQVLGTAMRAHLSPADQEAFGVILAQAGTESRRRKIKVKTSEGRLVPVYVSATLLHRAGAEPVVCLVLTDLEEVISAEEALRFERDRAQSYLDTVETPIVALDLQGRITAVNRKCCEITGWSEEELLGQLWFATCLPQPDALETLYPQFLRLIAGKTEATESFENPIVTKNGELRQIAWHNALLRDDQGRITGALSSGEDVTERKRVEDALSESEIRLRTILLTIPDLIWLKDTAGVYLICNTTFERFFGAPVADIVGKTDYDYVSRELADLFREHDRKAMAAGKPSRNEEWVTFADDGHRALLETIKTPMLDAKGAMIGVLGIARDITERRQAESDRERLTVAIEEAGEPVMITDDRGTIQYVNPVFETVTGYSRAEVLGKSSRILKSGKHDAALYREAMDTIKSGRVWRGRLANSRKDGSLFTVESTISPVHDAAGRIVNYVGVERDITEQLRLAEERLRIEDQLRQAQKVEAIGRLAGGVAHDFNNLTAIVLGYGEMLLGQLRPEDPARKSVEQIIEAGRRSAALTRQLLAFSRKQTLQPEVLDLNALLRNLEKMLSRIIGEDLQLELKLAEDLGRVRADPGQIEQVVTNLTINARDAMPRGGRLTVETADVELDEKFALEHPHVVPGKYVLLALTDTGCGMDKATMTRLFEPFFTTKEKGKGTGLGLATAYGIVKQSGGHIWASTEPGKGTSFKIYLPWTDAQPLAKAVAVGGEAPRGGGERILLVEDEASLRELCEIVLSGLGYRVSAASSGPEALFLVEEQRFEPDIVVTDVVMPGMSGPEMAARLRGDRPNLKVLYMSGYPDEAIVRHGGLEPGTLFIQKPFTERALAVKVQETLGETTVAAPSGRRVLMIDDDEQFRELVQHYCAKGGHVFAGVSDSAAALAVLAGQSFDVLLVDMNIPGTSGDRVLREIRAAGHATPAVILTGDVASADMEVLRPLGVVRALEKSSAAAPLLQAIAEARAPG